MFSRLGANYADVPTWLEHHSAFFADSRARIERLLKDGNAFIGDIASFKKVFAQRSGITVSTIHGVKGAEYDVVIAYALLDGMVPHFSDETPDESALKLLYVICSRARKNLHLISERQRFNVKGHEYEPTPQILSCTFA